MEKKSDTWKIWVLAAVIFAIIIASRSVQAIVLPNGACSNITNTQTFNLSQYLNQSTLQVNFTEQVCAENVTSNFSIHQINYALYDGQNVSGELQNCRYSFSCQNNPNDPDICRIDRDLDPGESYFNDNGGCDVDFKCLESPRNDNRSILVSQEFKAVRQENETVTRVYNSTGQLILELPITKAFTQEFDLSFQCPTSSILQDLEQNPEFARMTRDQYQPIMYAHITLLEDSLRVREEDVNACHEKNNDLQGQLSASEYRAGQCSGETSGRVEAMTTKANASFIEAEQCRTSLASKTSESDTYVWMFIFSLFGNIIFITTTVALYKRNKNKDA